MRLLLGTLVFALAGVSPSHAAVGGPRPAAPATAASLDLTAILDHTDDLYSSRSSHATLSMRVVTEHATREMTMETWSKGDDRFLVRILTPAKEAGTKTLKSGSSVWNYFPKINQVTKVSASLLNAGWMGSHVTNGDLVKHTRMSQSYKYTKTFEGERGGESVIELTLEPKPNAAVVWGKVVVVVRRGDKNPVEIQYYDESKSLAQTWAFSDTKKLATREVPTTIRVTPAKKQRESTEIRYKALELDVPLDDDLFSNRSLQK